MRDPQKHSFRKTRQREEKLFCNPGNCRNTYEMDFKRRSLLATNLVHAALGKQLILNGDTKSSLFATQGKREERRLIVLSWQCGIFPHLSPYRTGKLFFIQHLLLTLPLLHNSWRIPSTVKYCGVVLKVPLILLARTIRHALISGGQPWLATYGNSFPTSIGRHVAQKIPSPLDLVCIWMPRRAFFPSRYICEEKVIPEARKKDGSSSSILLLFLRWVGI